MKFKPQLIQAYLQGEDIVGYDIEQLEDNPDFMEQAILTSQDYRLYDLCGEYAKRDYDLVRTLMETFSQNEEFITKVASYYLKVASIDLEEAEIMDINLLLLKYLKDHTSDVYLKASFMARTFYLKEQVLNEKLYLASTDEDFKAIYGKGFIVTLLNYPGSKLIKDYVAKEMADDLFAKSPDFCLENYLHDNYTKDQILKMGINNWIINFLNSYDNNLANYISANIKLVTDIRKRIELIINRWDYLEENKEAEIYEGIMDLIDEFWNEFFFSSSLRYDDVINYIGTNFDILAKLKKYNDDTWDYNYDEDAKIEWENLTFLEFANLMDLKKKVKKILVNRSIPDSYIQEEEGNQKILKLPKTQK